MDLMGLIVILPFAALSLWIIRTTFRKVLRGAVAPVPPRRFFLAAGLGLILGVVLGWFFDYQPAATIRLVGLPIPISILRLEDGTWIASPMPGVIRIAAGLTNVLVMVALALIPVALSVLFKELRSKGIPE